MADASTLAEQARRNGGGAETHEEEPEERSRLGSLEALIGAGSSLARTGQALAGELAGQAFRGVGRRLTANLDDRDPDYIRENLPLAWLAATLWFRGEVRNLGNVPEERPVLMVGNHSGGNLTPDTIVFTLAFCSYFGVERPFYQLAHNLVLASPYGQILRKYGTVAASHEHAQKALRSGAALLVYPGGDWEVHRSILRRNKVDLAGRKGFIRLALNEGVPIVPVVSCGGQETALFLTQGGWLARALRLDKAFRLKVLPISLSLPWIVNVGDFLGHLPLPAKITTEVLPAIDLNEQFGDDPDVDEVYEHITQVMQETLDGLAAERRFPVIG